MSPLFAPMCPFRVHGLAEPVQSLNGFTYRVNSVLDQSRRQRDKSQGQKTPLRNQTDTVAGGLDGTLYSNRTAKNTL